MPPALREETHLQYERSIPGQPYHYKGLNANAIKRGNEKKLMGQKNWTKAGGNHLGPSRRNLLKRSQYYLDTTACHRCQGLSEKNGVWRKKLYERIPPRRKRVFGERRSMAEKIWNRVSLPPEDFHCPGTIMKQHIPSSSQIPEEGAAGRTGVIFPCPVRQRRKQGSCSRKAGYQQ